MAKRASQEFDCDIEDCVSNMHDCSNYVESLKSLTLKTDQDGQKLDIIIPPSAYASSLGNNCILAVSCSDTSDYVLGDGFFKNFAVTFNYD